MRSRLPFASTLLIAALALGACDSEHSPTGPAADPAPPVVAPSLDVAPNSWLSRAPMPTARAGLVAATVNDDIYAIGGRNPNAQSLATVERYNPDGYLIAWSPMASLPSGRSWPSGATTINGKIYVAGGYAPNGGRTSTLYVYNAATNTWSSKAPTPIATAHGASAAIDGRLYVLTPPYSSSDPQRTRLHRYDPGTNSWVARASAPVNLQSAVVGVINGKLYAAGGVNENGGPHARLYVYNPSTNAWSRKADMPLARMAAAGRALNGRLYVIGGNGNAPYGTNYVYNPGNDTWSTRAAMPTPRYVAAAAAAGGWLYVLGGIPLGGFTAVATNETFVP
jgi:N-acetylneuraminic acid mutarotase